MGILLALGVMTLTPKKKTFFVLYSFPIVFCSSTFCDFSAF